MKITERRLRSIVKNVIAESAVSGPQLGKAYGCVVYGESVSFDSFVLRVVLDKEFNVRYAKEAIEMQEGRVVNSIGTTTLLAEFDTTTSMGKGHSPSLVAENIAFYVGRG